MSHSLPCHRNIIIVLLLVFISVNIFYSCIKSSPENKRPYANAGSDQVITLPIDSVILNGSSSSDPDGSITNYFWQQISGPTSGNIVNPGAVQTTAKNLLQGSYSFELKVTDDKNESDRDTVVINVTALNIPNHAPVAIAKGDTLVNEPISFTNLDGRSSYDPDNNPLTYSWSIISGPGQANIPNPAIANTSVYSLSPGRHSFQLRVTDSAGLSSTDTLNLLVNRPPVAIVAPPGQTILLPANTSSLNGSQSHDPDNNITGIQWIKQFGPNAYNLSNPDGLQTQLANLAEGNYCFLLELTDAGSLYSSRQVFIDVDTLIPSGISIISNRHWDLNCNLFAENINTYIPAGSNYKIYIRWKDAQNNLSRWFFARNISQANATEFFYHEIINTQLKIYSGQIDCGFDDAQYYEIGIVLL